MLSPHRLIEKGAKRSSHPIQTFFMLLTVVNKGWTLNRKQR